MRSLIDHFVDKIQRAGLATAGDILLGGLDEEVTWNRCDPLCEDLEEVLRRLGVMALLALRPAEPTRTVLHHLCRDGVDVIVPEDCETRTFMHDIPVVRRLDPPALVGALRRRKALVTADGWIVTWGAVSPEQAFVFASSVNFALLVKFLADHWQAARRERRNAGRRDVFDRVWAGLPQPPETSPPLQRGPFRREDEVLAAMDEAGRATVHHRLVDSFFGNLSVVFDGRLYISQTAAALDELAGHIDACPLDGSRCTGLTASSELAAHRDVLTRSGRRVLLHGHPLFAVVQSLLCDRRDCARRGRCHIECTEPRRVAGAPIVPGEVGNGPRGLCRTLGPAMETHDGVIVYGHGLFATGQEDFNEAFARLLEIERGCRRLYEESL